MHTAHKYYLCSTQITITKVKYKIFIFKLVYYMILRFTYIKLLESSSTCRNVLAIVVAGFAGGDSGGVGDDVATCRRYPLFVAAPCEPPPCSFRTRSLSVKHHC